MYKHILITTDGSELSTKGLLHGLELAKAVGARATVVTITDVWSSGVLAAAGPASIGEFEAAMQSAVEDILAEASKRCEETGITFEVKHIPNRYPADAIVETAQNLGCDLIVMASHGRRGLRKALLGSQTSEVLTTSTIPVLVVR